MHIALAQIHATGNDPERNARAILDAVAGAARAGADLVVAPALGVQVPAARDRRSDASLREDMRQALDRIVHEHAGPPLVLGWLAFDGSAARATAMLVRDGSALSCWTAAAGDDAPSSDGDPVLVRFGDARIAFSIADESLPDRARRAAAAGAQALVAPACSPFRVGCHALRHALLSRCAQDAGIAIYFVNAVGADHGNVLDGASFVTTAAGSIAQQLPAWHATVALAESSGGVPGSVRGSLGRDGDAHLYDALVLALREAVARGAFRNVSVRPGAELESALVLAMARDAIGTDRVVAAPGVSPPGAHDVTSLAVRVSNRTDLLLGRAEWPEDSTACLALLGDVSATLARRLAIYRNTIGRVMADDAIARPARDPAPELALTEIDAIIAAAIEQGRSRDELVAAGHASAAVEATLQALRHGTEHVAFPRVTSRPGDTPLR